jgi:hypothetical protein
MGARPAGKRPGRVGPPEAAGVPARQRRRRVEVVGRPARAVLDDQGCGPGGRALQPPGVAPTAAASCCLPGSAFGVVPGSAFGVVARTGTAARIGQAGRGRSRLAGPLPGLPGGAVSVYTLGALVALVAHLDRLRRLLGGGRRPQPAGPPASHRAPREDARPGLRTGGTRVGGASAAHRRRPGAGPARRWGPSRVARGGRFG